MSHEFDDDESTFTKLQKKLMCKIQGCLQPIAKNKPTFNIYEYTIAKAEALQLTTGEMRFVGAVFVLMAHSGLSVSSLVKVLEHLVDVEKALRDEGGQSSE